MGYDGDSSFIGRMQQDKLRAFKAALKASYQSRPIETERGAYRALINSDNLKSDYDRKIVSVDWSSGLDSGKTFRCLDDNSVWLVYLPYLTETVYLHSEIIRCRYTLEVNGRTYWVYFQGPTETDINWYIKSGINFNEPNLSGTIYITKDENTEEFFDRFDKIKIDGRRWKVDVVDRISVPGIIELEIEEDFTNDLEDLPEVIQESCDEIVGRSQVNQNETVGYMIQEKFYNPKYSWSIRGNNRVKILETKQDGRLVTVKIHQGAIGSFQIIYGDKKTGYHFNVSISRLCHVIQGPQKAFSYDMLYYSAKEKGGNWYVYPTTVARITEEDEDGVKVQVLANTNTNFTVEYVLQNGETDLLEVEVDTV